MGNCCGDFESDAPKETRLEKEEEYRKVVHKSNLYRSGAKGYKKNFEGKPPIPQKAPVSPLSPQKKKTNIDFSISNLFRYKTPSVATPTTVSTPVTPHDKDKEAKQPLVNTPQ
eukprot:900923_1